MTDTATGIGNSDIDIKNKVKEKEILVVQDQGFFIHDTGDTYEGSFEAKKKDRSVRMQGPGVYTTGEGDIYSGMWENDKLGANENIITYIDGSKYKGGIKDWCYHGNANYLFPDGAVLQCDFLENSPVGKLRLTDPNGHVWLGKPEHGYGWVNPVNHYFEMLPRTQSHNKIKKRIKAEYPISNQTETATKKPKTVVLLDKTDKMASSPRRGGKK